MEIMNSISPRRELILPDSTTTITHYLGKSDPLQISVEQNGLESLHDLLQGALTTKVDHSCLSPSTPMETDPSQTILDKAIMSPLFVDLKETRVPVQECLLVSAPDFLASPVSNSSSEEVSSTIHGYPSDEITHPPALVSGAPSVITSLDPVIVLSSSTTTHSLASLTLPVNSLSSGVRPNVVGNTSIGNSNNINIHLPMKTSINDGELNAAVGNGHPADVYTLTLTDGSVVQLRVQNAPAPASSSLAVAGHTSNSSGPISIALNEDGGHLVSKSAVSCTTTNLGAVSNPNQSASSHEFLFGSAQDINPSLVELVFDDDKATDWDSTVSEQLRETASASPASIAAEVILPFSNPQSPDPSLSLPPSPSLLDGSCSSHSDVLLSAPIIVADDDPLLQKCEEAASEAAQDLLNADFDLGDDSDHTLDDGSGSIDIDSESFRTIFASMENVSIETLKAQLSSLPDGQTDLEALLMAAKIDLSLEDIVGPPLTHVKRTMEKKALSDWQVQLCIKIRRRKKNTAAVRSSRRKRSQYVVNLREKVSDLQQRRKVADEENALLKQLTALWTRLCYEVEAEIQEGVRKQLGTRLASNCSSDIAEALLGSSSL